VKSDTSPAELSETSRPCSNEKFLLVKGIAGMGNRILAALGGILYARLSNRRLMIDWSDPMYSSDGSNTFHNFFSSKWCLPADKLPQTDSVYPPIWRDRLGDSARRVRLEPGYHSIDPRILDYREDLVVLIEHRARLDLLRPHFGRAFQRLTQMPDGAVLTKLLREDLILRPEIRHRVDQFKGRRFQSRMVGVHIRYSDYRSPLFAIIKKLNALLEREGDLQIFLATDNLEILNLFERNYSGVVSTSHWYGFPGATIHENSANAGPTETGMEALVDLYLLGECDYLIIDTASTFSYVAGLLNSAPSRNKMDVASGSKGNRRVRNAITWSLRRLRFFSWGCRLLPKLVAIRKL
jgi:hypothetical protein